MRLRAGTLYAALDRLRLDGLVGLDREEIVVLALAMAFQCETAWHRRQPVA